MSDLTLIVVEPITRTLSVEEAANRALALEALLRNERYEEEEELILARYEDEDRGNEDIAPLDKGDLVTDLLVTVVSLPNEPVQSGDVDEGEFEFHPEEEWENSADHAADYLSTQRYLRERKKRRDRDELHIAD